MDTITVRKYYIRKNADYYYEKYKIERAKI